MTNEKYIKLKKLKIYKKITNFIIVFLLLILLFFRWTGLIDNTPFSWKRPEISLIENENTDPISQKNDQLWINVNFNSHHSNIKEAIIYMDDNKDSKQELTEGSNTYIFKNLTKGEHKICYEISWSIFGYKKGYKTFNLNELSTIQYNPLTDLSRDEEKVNVHIEVEGEYLDINNESTLGIYYFKTEAVDYIKKNKKIIENIIETKNYKKAIFEIKQNKINVKDYIIKQDNLYKLNNGPNDFEIDKIQTDQEGNVEKLSENNDKNYFLLPMGITEYENKPYLVLASPINAYTYGIPKIEGINTYANQKGDIIVNNLIMEENNYDKTGEEYLQLDLYNCNVEEQEQNEPIEQEIIKLNDFKNKGYTFKNILKDDEYFNQPEENEIMEYSLGIQLKYGYKDNIKPSIDEQGPKESNYFQINKQVNSFKEEVDNKYFYKFPIYFYEYNQNDELENIIIDWSTASWYDQPEKDTKVSLQYKIESKNNELNMVNYENIDGYENISYKDISNLNPKNNLEFNKFDKFDKLNEGDVINLRIEIKIDIKNWWNEVINYEISYIKLPIIKI